MPPIVLSSFKYAGVYSDVDVFDALYHDRVYRPAMPAEKVLSILKEGRGTHFDPYLLDTLFSLLPGMYVVAESIVDDDPVEDPVEQPATYKIEPAADALGVLGN